MIEEYKLVLGLEIHIQLNSAQKMFCGCDANIWQAQPNTHTCPTCLGLPGALPVPNLESIKKTQLLGSALNCELSKQSHFDRKHYFYPDLPKGYQISQFTEPLCGCGFLELASGKRALIERVHLEEDTAKSFHEGAKTLIDFNKSGISLVEIVTEPCFTQVSDAVDFCKKIQDIARVLNISEADMEKGNMRLEANISLRSLEMEEKNVLPKYKVEVKNINSFRFMEKAVLFELKRQTKLLQAGETPKQENRGWDERKQSTVSQRDKEEAHDYRYFPESDIPPMIFEEAYFVDLKNSLPELPQQLKRRLMEESNLNVASAEFFSTGTGIQISAKLQEIKDLAKEVDVQKVANLLINKPQYRAMPAEQIVQAVVQPTNIQEKIGPEIEAVIIKVLKDNDSAVESYKAGKQSSFEFLMGQVLKNLETKPQIQTLRERVQYLLTH